MADDKKSADGFADALVDAFSTRLKSPLVGTYSLLFVVWNWRICLRLFDDITVDAKITAIEDVLAVPWDFVAPVLAVPWNFVAPAFLAGASLLVGQFGGAFFAWIGSYPQLRLIKSEQRLAEGRAGIMTSVKMKGLQSQVEQKEKELADKKKELGDLDLRARELELAEGKFKLEQERWTVDRDKDMVARAELDAAAEKLATDRADWDKRSTADKKDLAERQKVLEEREEEVDRKAKATEALANGEPIPVKKVAVEAEVARLASTGSLEVLQPVPRVPLEVQLPGIGPTGGTGVPSVQSAPATVALEGIAPTGGVGTIAVSAPADVQLPGIPPGGGEGSGDAAPLLDIRIQTRAIVKVGRIGEPGRPVLEVLVENHSASPLFLSSLSFEAEDGSSAFVGEDAFGTPMEVPPRLEGGDSFSLYVDPHDILRVDVKLNALVCAKVTDKIGREYRSGTGLHADLKAVLDGNLT